MKNRYKYFYLFMVFFMAGILQVSGNLSFSQQTKISLELNNITLKEAIKKIEAVSNYTFVYDNNIEDLNKIVKLQIKNSTIDQTLTKLLSETRISYKIINMQVILTKSDKEKIKISGKVTDEEGNTIPGVNIIVKGSTTGTITDFDGAFTIEAPEDAVLVFSFVGYEAHEEPIRGRQNITVSLKSSYQDIDEVVVVGYTTESKTLLTGSIGTISSNEIGGQPAGSVSMALQGKSSGVQVTQNSGTPGGGISVRIRGVSSISAGSDPLYIVDGIPVTSGNFSQISFGGQGINAVSDINPNEIESISILRDASAAAIYGARASNGVVLITTKRGKEGKTAINFGAYYGFQEVENTLDMLDARQWKEFKNDQAIQDGGEKPFSESDLNDNSINTDWMSEILQVAPIQNYELSASGGNEKSMFYIAANYFDQEGVVMGTDYEKLNGRINHDYKFSDKFNIGSSFGITYTHNTRKEGDQSLNSPLANAITLPPIFPVYNEDGSYNEDHEQLANPVSIAKHHINDAYTYRNIGNIFGEYEIIPGLKFKSKWGIDYMNLREHSYSPITTRQGKKYDGLGIEANTEITNLVSNNTLNYVRSFNQKHNVSALLGYSFEIYKRRSSFMRGQGFPNEKFEYIVSAAEVTEGDVRALDRGMNSYFGQLKYNFNDKYIFSVTSRFDGSSKFGENNQYGFFPGASAAWRVSEEDFFEVGAINEFKLRASYGLTGNDGIGDFASIGLYSGGYNYESESGISPVQLPNPDLKWETTAQLDAGFDIALIKNRIKINFDYYYKKTKDLLLERPIPNSSGFGSITSNIGELENKGIELGLTTENIKKPFSWTTVLNLSANRNEVTKLYKGQPLDNLGRGGNSVIEGEPIAIFYNWNALGVDPATGDIVFEDIDGDGKITTADRTKIGNPHPVFIGGITNSFDYKGFYLSIFLQFSYGNDVYNAARRYIENLKGGDNQLAVITDRWRNPGDVTQIPRATSADPNLNNRESSRYVEDGTYMRIKNVKLGYNFPKKWLKKLHINRLEAYCMGQNLYTFTEYSGMDPEMNYAGESTTRIGTDFFTYPQARTITFGINIGL